MADPAMAYPAATVGPGSGTLVRPQPASLADVVERVLDKGIVIAGDIQVDLVGVELLTIRIRLLVASVDRAREMGIDWWEHDPMLSSRAKVRRPLAADDGAGAGAGAGSGDRQPEATDPADETGETGNSGDSGDSGDRAGAAGAAGTEDGSG